MDSAHSTDDTRDDKRFAMLMIAASVIIFLVVWRSERGD